MTFTRCRASDRRYRTKCPPYLALARRWEMGLPTERSRAALYRQIRNEVTRMCTEARTRHVLILDEAHGLSKRRARRDAAAHQLRDGLGQSSLPALLRADGAAPPSRHGRTRSAQPTRRRPIYRPPLSTERGEQHAPTNYETHSIGTGDRSTGYCSRPGETTCRSERHATAIAPLSLRDRRPLKHRDHAHQKGRSRWTTSVRARATRMCASI